MAIKKFYPATLDNQTAIIEKLSKVLQPVAAPEYPRKVIDTDAGTITLTVKDPQNAAVGNVVVARWMKTAIIKNADHLPANPEDGTLVTEWTVRNLHHHGTTSGYVDHEANAEMKYRAFAYAENGEWTASDEFHTAEVFGFYIDTTDPNESTCVHYIRANETFARAHMDFDSGEFNYGGWEGAWIFEHFKPVMLGYDGEVLEELNPNNLAETVKGEASHISDTSFPGNAMNLVQPIFVKVWEEDALQYALFSPEKLDDDWECWSAKCHDGSYKPFALPLFEGSVQSDRLRSLATGVKPTGSTNAANEIVYAADNGENWYPTTFADEMLMRLLGVLVFGRLDSQKALGGTYVSGATALVLNCGSMTDKGMFWGANMHNADGSAKGTITGTKFFGMENWWCHRNRRSQGLNTVGNREIRIKLTPSEIDGTTRVGFSGGTAVADYSGYLSGGTVPGAYTSGSPIKKMKWGKFDCMIPAAADGTTATYFCDNVYSNSGVMGFLSSGYCGGGLVGGLFYSNLYSTPSLSIWNYGASPSYHAF